MIKIFFKPYRSTNLIILSAMLGVIIEFYDFTLFGIFAKIWAEKFFITTQRLALLASFSLFAAGFVGRPMGAFLFGYIGDKFGRRTSLFLSISLMGISTFSLGILPTYYSIGIWAVVLLTVCRISQGISTGGEYGTSAVFMIEHAIGKEGIASSLVVCSAIIGALLATFSASLCLDTYWRIPFIIGGIFSLIGFIIRLLTIETPAYIKLLPENRIFSNPLKEIKAHYMFAFLSTICTGGYAGAIAYFLIVFMGTYLTLFSSVSYQTSILFSCLGLCCFIAGALGCGYLGKNLKDGSILKYSALLGAVLSAPIFWGLQSSNFLLTLLSIIVLGFLAGSYGGCYFLFVSKLFPTHIRCTAVSLGHGIGLALFGGTFPAVSIFFIQYFHHVLAPAFYLSFLAIMGWYFVKTSLLKKGDPK